MNQMRAFKISFYFSTLLVVISMLVPSCGTKVKEEEEEVKVAEDSITDLPEILKKGKLVVLAETVLPPTLFIEVKKWVSNTNF